MQHEIQVDSIMDCIGFLVKANKANQLISKFTYYQINDLIYIIQMKPITNMILLILFLHITLVASITLPFDTTQITKHGTTFIGASCNANTVVDFAFSPNSLLTLSTDASATASYSGLRYLDVLGKEQDYTLVNAQAVSQVFLTGFPKTFLFKFTSGASTVFVAIPFIDGGSSPSSQTQQTINMSTQKDPILSSLSSITDGTASIPLSSFNYLNDLTYSKFYSIMDTSSMVTLLIAKIHFKFTPTITVTSSTTLFTAASYTFSSADTGDVLCWGSQYSYGFFQTHMRESVPLWTIVIFTLLFWLFNLLSSEVTAQVYERSFIDNKWTSWSMYSLYWLCHQQWFTRTSRSSLVLINFLWQCLVLAAIYNQQGMLVGKPIIIWSAIIAYIVSIPVPYLLGNIFFKRIYSIEIQKFKTRKEMRVQNDKKKHEQMEKSAILMEQHIGGIFYFFYSMCILVVIVFSALCVHLMHQFPRNYYYLNWDWLASVGIAFGFDHLIVDPILTVIFGQSPWYQSRGYYYNSELGETARKLD